MTQLCRFVDVMFHLVELVGWLQILLVVSHKLFGLNLSALFSTGFCSEWRQEERGELENLVPGFSFCQSICHMSCSNRGVDILT